MRESALLIIKRANRYPLEILETLVEPELLFVLPLFGPALGE